MATRTAILDVKIVLINALKKSRRGKLRLVREIAAVGEDRFVADSPLEEAVSSELVSEAPQIPC